MDNLSVEELQILVEKISTLDHNQFDNLIKAFPFEKLANPSILNVDKIRLYLKLLINISKVEIFYNSLESVEQTLDFVLLPIFNKDTVCQEEILNDRLNLIKMIISKICQDCALSKKLVDQERIFDALESTAKLGIFNKEHSKSCALILKDILLNENLTLSTNPSIAVILTKFIELGSFFEIALMCNIVFRKFDISSEIFSICTNWLLSNSPKLLKEIATEETLVEVIRAINFFYFYYKPFIINQNCAMPLHENFNQFLTNLMKEADKLCVLSCRITLRNDSLQLLSNLLYEFAQTGDLMLPAQINVLEELAKFPPAIKNWPSIKNVMFFYLCHFLYSHSRLMWREQEILLSITSLIYSLDRFYIDIPLLKTICFLFPIMLIKSPDTKTFILGDDILRILMKQPNLINQMYSSNLTQLIWILSRGTIFLQKHILTFWLLKQNEASVVAKAIKHCKVQKVLLEILLNETNEEITNRAIEITYTMEDSSFSKDLTTQLVWFTKEKNILHRLILCHLGIPDNKCVAIKLCAFMAALLPKLKEENVLKKACIYSNQLITSLKNEEDAVVHFCQNVSKIQFLIQKIEIVQDETAIEILRLLKALLLVQKRNHLIPKTCLEEDMTLCLQGSLTKTQKALDLIHLILTTENAIIQMKESSVLNTCSQLFQLCQTSTLTIRCYNSLGYLLKLNQWLINSTSMNMFLEVQCCITPPNSVFSGPLFNLLFLWMDQIKYNPLRVYCYLPDENVESFVQRNPKFQKAKVKKCLKLMKIIR